MRVLLLNNGKRGRAERVRMGFLVQLKDVDGIDLLIYGDKERAEHPELAPLVYKSSLSGGDVIKELTPDVMIFVLWGPQAKDWVPKDIGGHNIPFVVFETDHYLYGDTIGIVGDPQKSNEVLDWYKEMNTALVLRRHFYENESKDCPVPTVWLPHSANTKEFYPDESVERKKKIAFVASLGNIKHRHIRKEALMYIKKAELQDGSYTVGAKAYPNHLRSYVGALTCSGGIIHTTLAKTFEIPMSGTAMLTNRFNNSKELFGDKPCYFEYKDDCSDVVSQAKMLLEDDDMRNEVVANALEIVNSRHTDVHRTHELYAILKALIEGKEIPKVWGQ